MLSLVSDHLFNDPGSNKSMWLLLSEWLSHCWGVIPFIPAYRSWLMALVPGLQGRKAQRKV